MKKAITFYFGNADWELQNSDRYSTEWNKIKKELDEIKTIWKKNTTKDFPNLTFIIGNSFKEHKSRFKYFNEPKGKYPAKDRWVQNYMGNGLKYVQRPIMIGSDGLGKLHEWDIVCQDKYKDNTVLLTGSFVKQKFKTYNFIKEQAKINSWKAYTEFIYTKQFVYHIFGHMIKLREMKSCPIMNRHKNNWQLGANSTQYMLGLDTNNTLDKRLAYYIKRKFK